MSVKSLPGGVVYFYSATNKRSRAASWSIFAPPRTPSKEIAENTFAKAVAMLRKLGLNVSRDKTQRASIEEGFEFLGIDLSNGFIRPTKKARERVLASIDSMLSESRDAFRVHTKTGVLSNPLSLLESLHKLGGIMQGWGKHYRFCNDTNCFEQLDVRVSSLIRNYLAVYREERDKTDDAGRWRLLGIEALAQIKRDPFIWPKKVMKHFSLGKCAEVPSGR